MTTYKGFRIPENLEEIKKMSMFDSDNHLTYADDNMSSYYEYLNFKYEDIVKDFDTLYKKYLSTVKEFIDFLLLKEEENDNLQRIQDSGEYG